MTAKPRYDLEPGRQRAAAMKKRASASLDAAVQRVLAEGRDVEPRAIAARLRLSYEQVRRSLIRLSLWRGREKKS